MVDISQKDISERVAIASGKVFMNPNTMELIQKNSVAKGDVLAVSRVAGIMAAKRCPDLVPLCHPIPISSVKVDFEAENETTLVITAEVKTNHNTGVEMEALTAVSVAALTIYDMVKAVDREVVIGEIKLNYKSGGRSGVFDRDRKLAA
jgi:cyclic pyranopterin phosphate synthase